MDPLHSIAVTLFLLVLTFFNQSGWKGHKISL